jgi:deoxyribodipyrimidine photo-lyase
LRRACAKPSEERVPSRREVPPLRIRAVNRAAIRSDGDFVLYWMIAARRPFESFSLERAVAHAVVLGKPLVVFEPLRAGYPFASERLHGFVIDGMRDQAAWLATRTATYGPYVEPADGAGAGLLEALAARACVVVTDAYPAFFLPRMVEAAGVKLGVRLEAVDSNGILPLRGAPKLFTTAASYRRYMQKVVKGHLEEAPAHDPLDGVALPRLRALPLPITARWPAADLDALVAPGGLDRLPIDHRVGATEERGGFTAAEARWKRFLAQKFTSYADGHNHPDHGAQTGLSPWLHFGHLSPHRMFRDVAAREAWRLESLEGKKATGKREGFWGMSENAEALLEQLLVWRELGFNGCERDPHHAEYDALPAWAKTTLDAHATDRRKHVYTLEELEEARTHDAIWNAAQRELRQDGRIHNYLRMLWGKKILEWTRSPREALEIMIELNDRYALDGRDPNSIAGIFWVLGRYDRAWGPERPIFGKVRYMSSEAAKRKLRMRDYLTRWSGS